MHTIADISKFLENFAPSRLAEDWDNVGLLVGDSQAGVTKVMTCLTITPASAAEAIAAGAELIVTHHPLPFRPLKRMTADNPTGKMLLDLIRAGVAIYSPHTAFDSTLGGINERLAAGVGLKSIEVLKPNVGDPQSLGAGRCGQVEPSIGIEALAHRVKQFLKIEQLQLVGSTNATANRVAVACGGAGEFLEIAAAANCDTLITGEVSFHTCLAAEALGVSLILTGHYASERFAVEALAALLAVQFPPLTIWASRHEQDPLRWL